ncbi:kinase-like domain-containing protein, partial [Podospora australis]
VEVPIPKQDRFEERYTPIPSQPLAKYYYGNKTKKLDQIDIAPGDWGVSSWIDKHLTKHIQPVLLRSPEVLIEAPWDQSTDIWNLGAVLPENFRAIRLFSGQVPPGEQYKLRSHLAEIVAASGPFPKELLEKSNVEIVQSMFDDERKIKDLGWNVEYPAFSSEELFPGLEQKTREVFGSLLSTMLKVDPVERPTAEQLLGHPWFDSDLQLA